MSWCRLSQTGIVWKQMHFPWAVRPLVTVQILMRYGMRFSMDIVPQLQPWHLHINERPFMCYVCVTLPIWQRCWNNRNTLTSGWRRRRRNIPFPVHQYQLDCYTYQEHVALLVMCAIYDRSIASDPCCARVLGTPSNALTNNAADKYVIPFDSDVHLGNWVSHDTTCVPF
jgi:hypothetical protein